MLFMLKRGRRSLWFAVRSVATAVVCIVVAIILHKIAIPALDNMSDQLETNVPTVTYLIIDNHQWLPWIPVPALVVGIAAVILCPMRCILTPVAVITSLIAVIIVIGSLIVVMMPMYLTMNDLISK